MRLRSLSSLPALIFFFLVGWVMSACFSEKIVCQAIRTADDACVTIDMIGADGKHTQVPVTPKELQGFARQTAARREAEKKAGVPMGTPLPMTPDPK